MQENLILIVTSMKLMTIFFQAKSKKIRHKRSLHTFNYYEVWILKKIYTISEDSLKFLLV